MNIAIIGNGGRENALAWAVRKSPKTENLYILSGNGGTEKYGINVHIDLQPPFSAIVDFVKTEKIDLVIVGPEKPLVEGLVDVLSGHGIPVFGPSSKAARLEGSKAFMKEFMQRNSIPTAGFRIFHSPDEAIDYVKEQNKPFVVKTDGLAAGKGALVCKTMEETLDAIEKIMVRKEFGNAGDKVVLEELLEGEEVSVFVLSDGSDFIWLASAQDHKRVFDNDLGPNTGGMGAYAPTPFIDEELKEIITDSIVEPTISGMQREGSPYCGILYVGLMLTKDGPKVIEYNARFGDPEAEVVLPLLKTDFVDIALRAVGSQLTSLNCEFESGFCTGIVIASKGYPDSYRKGFAISGDLNDEKDVFVFHAGTKKLPDGKIVTDGGRVFCVTALGSSLEESIKKAYLKAENIHFEGAFYRKDIGAKGLRGK
jgi:phosphoribosylamine--glycine ligase